MLSDKCQCIQKYSNVYWDCTKIPLISFSNLVQTHVTFLQAQNLSQVANKLSIGLSICRWCWDGNTYCLCRNFWKHGRRDSSVICVSLCSYQQFCYTNTCDAAVFAALHELLWLQHHFCLWLLDHRLLLRPLLHNLPAVLSPGLTAQKSLSQTLLALYIHFLPLSHLTVKQLGI